jgi:hypothetical protein
MFHFKMKAVNDKQKDGEQTPGYAKGCKRGSSSRLSR